jgi:hypothetical protein
MILKLMCIWLVFNQYYNVCRYTQPALEVAAPTVFVAWLRACLDALNTQVVN